MRIERSGVTVKTVYSPAGREWFSTPKVNGTFTFMSRWLSVWAKRVAAVSNRQVVISVRALFIGVSPFQLAGNPADRSHFAAIRTLAQWSGSGLRLCYGCPGKPSYQRGCQEKNPPRSLQGDIDVVLCIQPRLWRGGVFVLAALSSLVIPGRPTQLVVPTRGFHAAMVRRLGIRKLRKQRDWLSANHDPIGGSRPIAFLGRARGHRIEMETRC